MSDPALLPDDVAKGVDVLVDAAARERRFGESDGTMTFLVKNVSVDGMPAGDYQVVVRPRRSDLATRLSGLNNPWMRGLG